MFKSLSLVRRNFARMMCKDAINSALSQELERDPLVYLMGEEVAQYQGAFRISKGLLDIYGAERVRDTPITEAGFTGLGVGSAMAGLKPIIEFMTFNFAMQAIDHIINSAAKIHYMSSGIMSCPIVFRGINGSAHSVGAQHSQCFAAWYSNIPGLIVLSPYDGEDCRGLLKQAIRNPNPVVFLENEIMYSEQFDLSDEVMGMDFLLPIGKAKIMREGKDVTIVAFSKMVGDALLAAEKLSREGISCEVINLRSLRPLDTDTIMKSVRKTNHLVTVEEGWGQCGIGAEICGAIMDTDTFLHLDSAVVRVTGMDIPTPYAFNLEDISFPKTNNIIEGVRQSLNKK